MNKITHLIIGGGPTGLGAACKFNEEQADWHLLEQETIFGGLASSWVDEKGFTWDIGGHVQFSHYETFDRYMEKALGEEGWNTLERESWVWLKNVFVPYPFQNNLHRLPPDDQWACVQGLLQAHDQEKGKPDNFGAWIQQTFGQGIADLFMCPYNFKVWAYPPEEMMYEWIGERVAVPPLDKVLRGICLQEDAVSWGPNAVFKFPKHGGTGAIWKSIGEMLPQEKVSLGTRVLSIDPDKKQVKTASGQVWEYEHLISTIPLNKLIELCPDDPVPLQKTAELKYSSTNVVGIGLDGETPDHLKTKCWMYFPESNSPYYRVTVFTNYSAHNAPKPGEQWSLMTETAESDAKPVDHKTLVEDTIKALVEDQLIPDPDKIVSKEYRRLEQGYPTPFLDRNAVTDPMLRAFERKDIYSRGRFGAWKYEVANQDHSFAQGRECATRLLVGGDAEQEPTLHKPAWVNSRKNP